MKLLRMDVTIGSHRLRMSVVQKKFERLTGRTIQGYRQPRMFPVSDTELERMGYVYNSSLNPAFIPGRYMHLSEPRTCFMTGKLLPDSGFCNSVDSFPAILVVLS